MKALRDKHGFLIYEAHSIQFGIKEHYGCGWYLYDINGNETGFVSDGEEYEIVEFDPSTKPSDYEVYKYRFIRNHIFAPVDDYYNHRTFNPYNPTNSNIIASIASINKRLDDIENAICELSKYIASNQVSSK